MRYQAALRPVMHSIKDAIIRYIAIKRQVSSITFAYNRSSGLIDDDHARYPKALVAIGRFTDRLAWLCAGSVFHACPRKASLALRHHF